MPELPAGTDRSTLVVVRPKTVPEGVKPEDVPEHIVGAAWLEGFPEDFEFVRFDGETPEQAAAREEAAAKDAAASEAPTPKGETPQRRTAADAFN